MIRVEITSGDYIKGGIVGIVQKLRACGIPVRISMDTDIRLLPVWTSDGKTCLGYGILVRQNSDDGKGFVFTYKPPTRMGKYGPIVEDETVIDVEARVIIDTPLLPDN